jgi:hypothetical protein
MLLKPIQSEDRPKGKLGNLFPLSSVKHTLGNIAAVLFPGLQF